MSKFSWVKIYFLLVIISGLVFIGFNIFASVEETSQELRTYKKGCADYKTPASCAAPICTWDSALNVCKSNCPNFIDMNELTMKDECTGLVWARRELPTYHGGANPGYDWQQAKDACANFISKELFRLPTVEELLTLVKFQCVGDKCSAGLDLDFNKDGTADFKAPFFANGIYWSINNFNELPSWTDPANRPTPGSPDRDYKRSVNLLNGQVDSPVFGKEMRLNAWCVIDRTPEIFERKFISATTIEISNGTAVSTGQLQTVFNRRCATNAGCDVLSGTVCDNGYCAIIPTANNITLAQPVVLGCNTDPEPGKSYHLENNNCVVDKDLPLSPCGLDDSGYRIWRGNDFNGYMICIMDSCPAGRHQDPDTFLCVDNEQPCYLENGACSLGGQLCSPDNPCQPETGICQNWTLEAVRRWDATTANWGPCHAKTCLLDSQPIDNQNEDINNILNYDATCQCPAGSSVREGFCTACGAEEHYRLRTETSLSACVAVGGSWSGSACYGCVNNMGDLCGYCQGGDNAGSFCTAANANTVCSGTGANCNFDQPEIYNAQWQGGLFAGSYSCQFQGCPEGYHELANKCISNVFQGCSLHDPYSWVIDSQSLWTEADGWGLCNATNCAPASVTQANSALCSSQLNLAACQAQDLCVWDLNTEQCKAPTLCMCVNNGVYSSEPIIRDNMCTYCGNGVVDGICSNSIYNSREACLNNSANWIGEECDTGMGRVVPIEERKIDLVFLFDTSGSMTTAQQSICTITKDVIASLLNDYYVITTDIPCANDSACSSAGREFETSVRCSNTINSSDCAYLIKTNKKDGTNNLIDGEAVCKASLNDSSNNVCFVTPPSYCQNSVCKVNQPYFSEIRTDFFALPNGGLFPECRTGILGSVSSAGNEYNNFNTAIRCTNVSDCYNFYKSTSGVTCSTAGLCFLSNDCTNNPDICMSKYINESGCFSNSCRVKNTAYYPNCQYYTDQYNLCFNDCQNAAVCEGNCKNFFASQCNNANLQGICNWVSVDDSGYCSPADGVTRRVDGYTFEDWGEGIIDIINNRKWLEGYLKIIIPVSDEGPQDGSGILMSDGPDKPWNSGDYDILFASGNVVDLAKQNNVRISPVYSWDLWLGSSSTYVPYNINNSINFGGTIGSHTIRDLVNRLASETKGQAFFSQKTCQGGTNAGSNCLRHSDCTSNSCLDSNFSVRLSNSLNDMIRSLANICDDTTGDGIMDCVYSMGL